MRFRTSPEAPEENLAYCSHCDHESIEFHSEWLGNPAYEVCVNEDCSSHQEDEE